MKARCTTRRERGYVHDCSLRSPATQAAPESCRPVTDFQEVYERVPWLRDAGTPQRLAGLTNLNYRIGDYVLRISGAGTSEYISRTEEEVAARSAAAAG